MLVVVEGGTIVYFVADFLPDFDIEIEFMFEFIAVLCGLFGVYI